MTLGALAALTLVLTPSGLALRRGDATMAASLTTRLATSSPVSARRTRDVWSTLLVARRTDADAVLSSLLQDVLA